MPLSKKHFARHKVNQKILALHRAIADKLIRSPELVESAKHCMESRYEQRIMRYNAYVVWQSLLPLLDTEPELFKQELLAEDAKMEQLRRETIFVGILNEEERREVLAQCEASTSLDN